MSGLGLLGLGFRAEALWLGVGCGAVRLEGLRVVFQFKGVALKLGVWASILDTGGKLPCF